MMTEPIETYILKTKHNFRIASAVGEAWPNARERMVAGFLDRLEARLKRRLKGYEFSRWGGRFFEDAYPGYSLFKSMWNNYAVGIECHEYGGQMLFGVIREKPRRGREPRSEELLTAVQEIHPSARTNAWWVVRIVMTVPAPDWRKPDVLWQMHTDTKFLDRVAEQLLELAKISTPFIDRWERKK